MEGSIQALFCWGLVGCGLLSLLPVRFERGWKSWPLYLPAAGLILYMVQTCSTLPGAGGSYRAGLVVTSMMFIWLNGMAKFGLMQVLMALAGGSRRRWRSLPQRRLQLALALPILAGCVFFHMLR